MPRLVHCHDPNRCTGRIPTESVDLLTKVGKWMEVNGEAVYGTQASPFRCRLPWGCCTTKPDGEDTILYLHVLDVPKNGRLMLPGLKNQVLAASLLSGGRTLEVSDSPHGPCLILPAIKLNEDNVSITIKLRLKAVPEGWHSVNVFSVELVPVKGK